MPGTQKYFNVLIVEDSPEDCYQLTKLCQEKSFIKSISTAETLKEAAEIISDRSIDVILIDYNLPDGLATELLYWLSNRNEGNPIGIIALTGLGSEKIAASLIKAGAHEYMIKDEITVANLEDAIFHAYEQATLRSQLRYLANHDTLTGLANRRLFNDRVKQAILRATRQDSQCALILIDLDHFKLINDNLGHEVGDELLKHIAKLLRSSIRASDTLCRWGGDELVILLENITPQNLEEILLKLQRLTQTPMTSRTRSVSFSFSMGAACFPTDGRSARQLLKSADIALYQAKERGRHQYQYYSTELNNKAEKDHALSAEISEAIKGEEFYLLFQPIVDIYTGEHQVLEALCRWKHPQHGELIPLDFIKLLEASPLLDDFHHWLIKTACLSLNKYNEANNQNISVSINLPAKALHENTLKMLLELTKEYNIAPSSFWLEINERQLTAQYSHMSSRLDEFCSHGFTVIIDDFATANTSVRQLTEIPVKGLKLDGSIVCTMLDVPQSQVISKAVFGLCHALDILPIAKGIEEEEQLELIKMHGYSSGQGFYFSKPALLEEFLVRRPKKRKKRLTR